MSDSKVREAFEIMAVICDARSKAGKLLLALDFDGTLAAIVPNPNEAALIEGAAPVLARLAQRDDTTLAVITGRGIEDARRRMGMQHIHYSGNHGLEIEGPGFDWMHPEAEAQRATIAAVLSELAEIQKEWPEIIIENKRISLSVHFRTVENPDEGERIVARVHELAARAGGRIKLTGGRRVVEIRPDIEWDKGTSLVKLRDALGMNDAPCIFIGDDRTDEDAFREMNSVCDVGILVGRNRIAETRATAVIDSPAEVVRFLDILSTC